MKKIIILLITLLLVGCAQSNVNIHYSLDSILSNRETPELRRNNFTDYFDYYAPFDIKEESFDPMSVTFSFEDALINLNVNVSSIVNKNYYPDYELSDEGYFDSTKLIYSSNGTLVNSEDETLKYFLNLYQVGSYYFYYLKSETVCIYARCFEKDLVDVANKIVIMAKMTNVKIDKVLTQYNNKDVIDYEKKAIKLFDTKMPENGNINDLILDNDNQSIEE